MSRKRRQHVNAPPTGSPLVFYRCPKCRREYDLRKDAVLCEVSHLRVVAARELQYTVRPYPFSVEVTFNNGETRIYRAEDLGG